MCTTNCPIYAPRAGSPGPNKGGRGDWGTSDGKDEVRCVGSRSLGGHGLLIMFYLRCGDPEEGN